jgi:hypothetical protein
LRSKRGEYRAKAKSLFDYVFRFPSADRAKVVLPDFWRRQGWQSGVAMETVLFEDGSATADYCVLVASSEGDGRLRAMPECILELNRSAVVHNFVYILSSRLSDQELRRVYFSPAFPGSIYPRPLLEPRGGARKLRVWRP